MRLISGTLRSTPLPCLPVLSNIEPVAATKTNKDWLTVLQFDLKKFDGVHTNIIAPRRQANQKRWICCSMWKNLLCHSTVVQDHRVISLFGLILTKDWYSTFFGLYSGVEINQSSPRKLTAHSLAWSHSLSSLIAMFLYLLELAKMWSDFRSIIIPQCRLPINWLTYLVHANSTGELISLASAIAQFEVWSLNESFSENLNPNEKWLRFLAIFGLSSNLGLSERL